MRRRHRTPACEQFSAH